MAPRDLAAGLKSVPDNRPNVVLAGFGLAALAAFAGLYTLRRDLYFAIIDWWSFQPFNHPFVDLQYVLAEVKCWSMGIDVYVQSPCDPLGRLHDYSPLWLRLSFLGSANSFLNSLGLLMDGLFMLSLVALPRPRQRIDYLPVLLCVVSPMTVFALERGNVDILMFLLAIVAVICIERALPVRLLGYAAILLGSLLKFFPFVLFILLLRERLRVFVFTALTAIFVVGGFVWFYLDEVRLMLANIPHPPYFTDGFGAAQLPQGIGIILQYLLDPAAVDRGAHSGIVLFIATSLVLTVVAYVIARNLAGRPDFRSAWLALTPRESLCLIAGATLVCGCFLSERSIGYREIIILMAMPGMSAMVRVSPTRSLAQIFRTTIWVAVFLMSYLVPQRLLYDWFGGDPAIGGTFPTLAFWLLRELCRWWFVAVLGAVLIRFVLDSLVWLTVTGSRPQWRTKSHFERGPTPQDP